MYFIFVFDCLFEFSLILTCFSFYFLKEKTVGHKLIIIFFRLFHLFSSIIEEKKGNFLVSLDPEIFL